MRKRKPTYDLEAFKAAMSDPKNMAITTTARRDARGLGFDDAKISAVIQTMDRSQFKESITSNNDHRVWQDYYHVPAGDELLLYVKFTAEVVTEFVLLSFKEK